MIAIPVAVLAILLFLLGYRLGREKSKRQMMFFLFWSSERWSQKDLTPQQHVGYLKFCSFLGRMEERGILWTNHWERELGK